MNAAQSCPNSWSVGSRSVALSRLLYPSISLPIAEGVGLNQECESFWPPYSRRRQRVDPEPKCQQSGSRGVSQCPSSYEILLCMEEYIRHRVFVRLLCFFSQSYCIYHHTFAVVRRLYTRSLTWWISKRESKCNSKWAL